MNLRQYRRSEIIQAAPITGCDPVLDAVTVSDVDGQPLTIVSPGLCHDGGPKPGDWLLMHPDGSAAWVPAVAFNDGWEPVKGPLLS